MPGENGVVGLEEAERDSQGEAEGLSSRPLRYRHPELSEATRVRSARRLQSDAFDALLRDAGLEEQDSRPVEGSSISPAHAARLLSVLLGKDVTLGQFPARVAVGFMLREVLATGEVSRAELARRVERFSGVAVLRPDGYLAWVRTGTTQQRVAPVEWRDGAFRAHGFELGRFYGGRTGVFRLLDMELREASKSPLADVHDDADVISRGLDGAEEAFVGLALAVGKFVTDLRPAS